MEGYSAQKKTFRAGTRVFQRNGRPFIMGILNVTPDSFSDGGKFLNPDAAVEHALRMAADGADFIDIGGESSRPGSDPVPLEEELRRVLPVLKALRSVCDVPISIDTTKAGVAAAALEAGAVLLNDISALRFDPEMLNVLRASEAAVVLMHMQGEPKTMQDHPHYDNLIAEIRSFLEERIAFLLDAGIDRDRILVDPGIGFGKRLEDNFELLARLSEFSDLGPLLVGPSRKAFLGKLLNRPPQERLFGTAAAAAVATMNGADILRVHDVGPIREVVEVVQRCSEASVRAE